MIVAVAVWVYAALAGAFLAGAATAAVTIFLVGRRLIRRKLGGLLDLTVLSKS